MAFGATLKPCPWTENMILGRRASALAISSPGRRFALPFSARSPASRPSLPMSVRIAREAHSGRCGIAPIKFNDYRRSEALSARYMAKNDVKCGRLRREAQMRRFKKVVHQRVGYSGINSASSESQTSHVFHLLGWFNCTDVPRIGIVVHETCSERVCVMLFT